MDRSTDDARVLVFAPGLNNARVIARRLAVAGIECRRCDDAVRFEATLREEHMSVGAVVLTAAAVRAGAAAALSRFKAGEPAWSALPIVILAPPGEMTVPPWPHTTLVTTPTTKKLLTGVVERSLDARRRQRIMASTTDELRHAAFHDALTGLPNRSALYDRIQSLQRDRRGSRSSFETVFVDVDGFKRINDEYGHITGDEVLRRVADHLVSTVREGDFVARWGGDEFMVLLDRVNGPEVVSTTVERLGRRLVLTLQTLHAPLAVSFSVGHVEGIAPDLSTDEILALADKRMYEHKEHSRRGTDSADGQ